MAVTSDQLLVNVAVNTEKASASLDLLAKELGQLRGEFSKTSANSEKATKAVTDFGLANLKIAGILSNVEKSAKLVGKALKFAFGDEFIKSATEQFEKLGAEIGGAISEGLQVDVGKELVETLKDVTEAFKEIKPAIVDGVAAVKDFAVAVKDGLMAIDWEKMAKLLGVIGGAVVLAFAPQIIAAVGAFAASMAAAAVPVALIALKIVVIGAALATVAGVVAIVVKNFDLLGKIIKSGLLLAFTNAKAAMLDFGVSAIQTLTKIIAKAGELFPAFSGIAAAAVNSLTGQMVELAESSKAAHAEAEELGLAMDSAISNIDLTPVTDVVDEAKKGWDAFTGSLDNSAAAGHRVKFAVRATAKEIEEAKKRAEEFKKAQEELAKFLAGQQAAVAGVNATEIDGIKAKAAADRESLGLLLKRLTANGKITEEIKNQIAASQAAIASTEALSIDKQRLDTLKDIADENMRLAASMAAAGMSERERLDLELELAQKSVDMRIEALSKNRAENAQAIAGLVRQKDLMAAITKERKSAADVEFKDVISSFKSVKLFDEGGIGRLGAALKDGFAYGLKILSGVGAVVATALGAAFDVLSGGPVNKLADYGEMIAGIPDALLKAFGRLDVLVDRFMGAFPQAVSKVLEAIPKIVDKVVEALPKIANTIADALPALAAKLGEVIPQLVRALAEQAPKLLGAIMDAMGALIDMLPAVFDALIDNLPKLIETFFAKIPDLFKSIFKAIPTIFESLMDNIDELVLALVEGIISAVVEIAGAFVDEFIMKGGLERMVGAFLRAVPRIAIALVQGILRGLSKGLGKLFGGGGGGVELPKVQIDTKQMTAAVKALGRKLSGEASKVFAVMDLGEEGKQAAENAKDVGKQVEESFGKGADAMKSWWQKFLDALKAAWLWVYNTIVAPLVEGIKAAWQWVYDTIIKPAWELLKTTWNALVSLLSSVWNGMMSILTATWNAVTGVLKTAWDGIVSVFKSVWDGIRVVWDTMMELFQGKISFMDAVGKIWGTMLDTAGKAWEAYAAVWGKMFDGAKGIFDKAKEAFEKTFTAFKDGATKIGESIWGAVKKGFDGAGDIFKGLGTTAWSSLKKGLEGVGGILKDALDAINPANLLAKAFKIDWGGKGTVENALNIDIPFTAFAQGGLVPGRAAVGGDSLLNDRILALLSPGEAIVPRSAMEDPTIAQLVRSIISGNLKVPQYGLGSVSVSSKGVSVDVGGTSVGVGTDGVSVGDQQILPGLDDLDPRKMWERAKEEAYKVVMRAFESNKFHSGGLVPRFAFGGDVPALLQPGEFVVNSGAVQSLGAPFMQAMNSGRAGAAMGDTHITQNFEIKTTEPIDEAFFRNRLMPKVKDELRRASLDGAFIISGSGVRKT